MQVRFLSEVEFCFSMTFNKIEYKAMVTTQIPSTRNSERKVSWIEIWEGRLNYTSPKDEMMDSAV